MCAGALGSPEASDPLVCYLSIMGSGTKLKFPVRAVNALNYQTISLAPSIATTIFDYYLLHSLGSVTLQNFEI